MQVDMSQFLDSFFDEANEHIENMEAGLLDLESSPDDGELLNTVFRAAHSIKGASSTFGVKRVGEFTHVLETLLDRMRDGEIQVTAESVEILLKSVDVLAGLLAVAREGSGEEPENTAEITAELQRLNGSEPSAATPAGGPAVTSVQEAAGPTRYDMVFKPSPQLFCLGLDPLLLIRDLDDCGTVSNVQMDAADLPPLDMRWTPRCAICHGR